VVKVLDFGLAKALAAQGSGPALSKSPTMTAGGTIIGVILGTAAYMSPQQARGQPVDRRTDIWAFGCVLFEMFTGSSAFARETVTDTIAAVVDAEPEWKSLPADTTGSIRRLLTRCLQKDIRRRLHDIADARIFKDTMATPAEPAPVPTPRRWSRLALSALSLGIATALVFLWAARDRFGRLAAEPSPPDTRVIVSRIFPASRSLRPFHQTAGRWRSPPALVANDRSLCSSLLVSCPNGSCHKLKACAAVVRCA
jgi:serine/threonine protein kinase